METRLKIQSDYLKKKIITLFQTLNYYTKMKMLWFIEANTLWMVLKEHRSTTTSGGRPYYELKFYDKRGYYE